jgi:hypothetical protein
LETSTEPKHNEPQYLTVADSITMCCSINPLSKGASMAKTIPVPDLIAGAVIKCAVSMDPTSGGRFFCATTPDGQKVKLVFDSGTTGADLRKKVMAGEVKEMDLQVVGLQLQTILSAQWVGLHIGSGTVSIPVEIPKAK